MDLPLVSVCLPTRDRVGFLRESLESVLAQGYPRLEVIVADNASSDGTGEFCAAVARADPRVRHYRPEWPLGLYANHNFAFRHTSGAYVCFFHDDDVYRPNIVERYVEFLERHAAASIVSADYDRIDERGTILERRRSSYAELTPGLGYIDRTLATGRSSVALSGAMARRSALPDPPFDEAGTPGFSDIVTWFRIAERSDVGHIGEPLWAYRVHPQAASQRKGAVAREFWVTFSAYCDEFLRRHPGELMRVRRWRKMIRRFRFWTLVYDLALHYAPSASSWSAPGAGRDGSASYRFSGEELRTVLRDLDDSATSPLERATLLLIGGLRRAHLASVMGWSVGLARYLRPFVRMG